MFSYKDWAKNISVFEEELLSQLESVESNLESQMEEALDLIEATSQSLVPEKTGATRDSFFRQVEKGDGYIKGIAGYDREGQLDYVPVIHSDPYAEVLTREGRWTKDGAENLFLEKGFTRNWPNIRREIIKVDKK